MRLLLDTHILLWALRNDPALPAHAKTLVLDSSNDIYVSAISLWEIVVKTRLGKLKADVDQTHAAILESGFAPLSFTLEHAAIVATLPDYHRDPFDRALVAQAQAEPLRLLTHDQALAAYGGVVLLV